MVLKIYLNGVLGYSYLPHIFILILCKMRLFLFLCLSGPFFLLRAQDTSWTSMDKQFLIQEYKRTRNEINELTQSLTPIQWSFKETSVSWSIGQVLEHLFMWELITQRDTRGAIWNGVNLNDVKKLIENDSIATNWIYEYKAHTSPDYTIPTGFIPGDVNLRLFNSKCDELIQEIETSDLNFKLYLRKIPGYNKNLIQLHKIHYGHVDRHIRQIKRIKTHLLFPK